PEPQGGGGIDAFRQGVTGRGLAGNAENSETLLITKGILHRPQLRGPLQLDDAIAALDRELHRFARVRANDALHVGKAVDLAAVDGSDDVTDLETRGRRRAARFDLVNARRSARLAEKGEETGENENRQDEIGNRTGGDDSGARAHLLVVEAALALLVA